LNDDEQQFELHQNDGYILFRCRLPLWRKMTLQLHTRFPRKADHAQAQGTAIGSIASRSRITPDFSEMRPGAKKAQLRRLGGFKAEPRANRIADCPL
jgi:hypothetical protein